MNKSGSEILDQNQPEQIKDSWSGIYEFAAKLVEEAKQSSWQERIGRKPLVRGFKFRGQDKMVRTRLEEKRMNKKPVIFLMTFFPANLSGDASTHGHLKLDAEFLTGKDEEYERITVFISSQGVIAHGYSGESKRKLELSSNPDSSRMFVSFLQRTAIHGVRPIVTSK